MADYSSQLNQIRANGRNIVKRIKTNLSDQTPEITMVEWLILFSLAIIADLLITFGFPFILIICFWYVMRFHKFPTGKVIGSGLVEAASAGILPGWTGFVAATCIEQKGYLSKLTGKLFKARIK